MRMRYKSERHKKKPMQTTVDCNGLFDEEFSTADVIGGQWYGAMPAGLEHAGTVQRGEVWTRDVHNALWRERTDEHEEHVVRSILNSKIIPVLLRSTQGLGL